MSDAVTRFLTRGGVNASPPDPAAVAVVAERFGPLPPALLALWRATGSVDLPRLNARAFGAAEVAEMTGDGGWDLPASAGWLPLVGTNESNYVMVAVRPPLAPRVLWVPHDDGARVLFRDLDGFLLALVPVVDADRNANDAFHDAAGDYAPDAPRTDDDRAAGRELLAAPPGEFNEWNLATQLLGPGDLPEWRRLLDTEHFVRRDAVARLGRVADPACRALLAESQRELAAFGAGVAAALRAAGVEGVGEPRDGTLRVGRSAYTLEGFFHRRRIPDALPRLVLFIQDQLAGRDWRDRPGNFFAD